MSLRVNGTTENTDNIQLNKVVTNPFTNCVFDGRLSSNNKTNQSLKEQLYAKAANLPDNISEQFLEYIEKGATKREFIDLLNERYEKKQAEFEVAWAEYQETKNNLKLLERIYNILQNKYGDSESNFEQSQLAQAEKNFNNADMSSWNKLLKCRDISHRLT